MKTTNEASRIIELEHELAQVKMELETMRRAELLCQLASGDRPVYITEGSLLSDRLFGKYVAEEVLR